MGTWRHHLAARSDVKPNLTLNASQQQAQSEQLVQLWWWLALTSEQTAVWPSGQELAQYIAQAPYSSAALAGRQITQHANDCSFMVVT
jgi:hypothetical protein